MKKLHTVSWSKKRKKKGTAHISNWLMLQLREVSDNPVSDQWSLYSPELNQYRFYLWAYWKTKLMTTTCKWKWNWRKIYKSNFKHFPRRASRGILKSVSERWSFSARKGLSFWILWFMIKPFNIIAFTVKEIFIFYCN